MADVPALPELVPAPPAASEIDEAILVGTADTIPWYPSTLDEAEWAMQKLAALEAREREIELQYASWRERIDDWKKAEAARIAPGIAFFDSRLRTYGLSRRYENEKDQKTTRLPSGEIATRGGGAPKVVVMDEERVIAWAQTTLTGPEYDAVVKTSESVLLTGLRSQVVARERAPLLTPGEWCAVTGYVIADPDGWRGQNEQPWAQPIDKDEFLLRASISTMAAPRGEPTMGEPESTWIAVHEATGEIVPGVGLDFPAITATVKLIGR